jgi:TRAP-type uncharacterized transport system substrate-binding protein
MAARDLLRNNWPAITIAVTAAIACMAIVMLRSMPPRMIVMATGPEGGSYYELGERYRAVLSEAGVEVRLIPTAGSQENLALLLDPRSGVSVALMQGGIVRAADSSELESLGTVFYEPLWWFHRREIKAVGLAGLQARRYRLGLKAAGLGRYVSNCSSVAGLSASSISANCWPCRRKQPLKSS